MENPFSSIDIHCIVVVTKKNSVVLEKAEKKGKEENNIYQIVPKKHCFIRAQNHFLQNGPGNCTKMISLFQ